MNVLRMTLKGGLVYNHASLTRWCRVLFPRSLPFVIMSGLDHMNSLGGTLDNIARHKAGVFKPGCAALVGPGCPMHVMEVGENAACFIFITPHPISVFAVLTLKEEAETTGSVLCCVYPVLKEACDAGFLPVTLHSHPLLTTLYDTVTAEDSPKNVFDPDVLCSQLALASLQLLQNPPTLLTSESSSPSHAHEKEDVRKHNSHLFSSCINVADSRLMDVLLTSRLPCRFEELIVTKQLLMPVNVTCSSALSIRQSQSQSALLSTEDSISQVSVRVILDVAHNIPALTALMRKLDEKFNSNFR